MGIDYQFVNNIHFYKKETPQIIASSQGFIKIINGRLSRHLSANMGFKSKRSGRISIHIDLLEKFYQLAIYSKQKTETHSELLPGGNFDV